MKRNLIVLALCCVVLAMVVGAVLLGPPGSDAGVATGSMATPAGEARTAKGVAADSPPTRAGFSVSSFGPVPGCSDELATAAVVGNLREHVPERTLGLSNIHVVGRSQVGDLVQWDCEADAQQADRQQHLRYRISQEVAGRESWRLTFSGQ